MQTENGIDSGRVEKAVKYIRDNAKVIGQLRGQKSYLEHRIKIILAQKFLSVDGTVAERESIARVAPEHAVLVDEYRDCVTEMHTLETGFKAAELLIEVWRTMQANNRRGHV